MSPPLIDNELSDFGNWCVCTFPDPLPRPHPHLATARSSECMSGKVPCFNYMGFFVLDIFIDLVIARITQNRSIRCLAMMKCFPSLTRS